jgi:Zn-dependent protease
VLAGPIPGVLFGTIFFLAANYYEIPSLLNLSVLFLFLNIINLLPLDPLDGGQMVKLLAKKRRDLFLLIFAFVSSLVLIVSGFIMEVWVLMIFGFLMGVRVRNLQKNLQQRKELEEKNIVFESTYQDLSNEEYAALRSYVLENNTLLRKYITYSDNIDEAVIASHVQALLVAPVRYDVGILGKVIVISVWFLATILVPLLLALDYISIDWYFKTPII